jgi:anti-sigma regulatory factor (Ser/Thr protein kinase)
LDQTTAELEYCNAGALLPCIIGDEQLVQLRICSAQNLGQDLCNTFEEGLVALGSNDKLCIYNEGVLQASSPNKELLGEQGVLEILAEAKGRDIKAIKNLVSMKIADYRQNQKNEKTMIMLFVQCKPKKIEVSDQLSIHFKNDVSEIEKLHSVVELFSKANNLPDKMKININLVLEELISNIIFYGYEDHEEHLVYVDFSLRDGVLSIVIEDDGMAFNPLNAPKVDVDAYLDDRPIGGLGIHFVKTLTESVAYARREEKNILSIKMKCERVVTAAA